MSFTYRVKVHNQTGTLRDTFTPADEFGDLAEFDVDSLGVCGDASFSILPTAVEVNLRDIVLLETSDDGGSNYSPLYLGMVVETPNARLDSLGSVRCVGLKQRFYEAIVGVAFIAGDDVATMFASGVAGINLPAAAGGLVSFTSSDSPIASFQLGGRYPKYETFGDFADELSAAVGSFIVPTGSTYTYDGKTFSAGDEVPEMRWGVTADGKLVFRRSVAAGLLFKENDASTDIEWISAQAEQAVNSVNLIYASAFDLDLFNQALTGSQTEFFVPNAAPIVRRFDSVGVTDASRISQNVAAPDALLLMSQLPSLGASLQGSWSNPANAVDDNPITFASANGTVDDAWIVSIQSTTTGSALAGGSFGQGILVVRYASAVPLSFGIFIFAEPFGDLLGLLSGVLPATPSINDPTTVGLLVAEPLENQSYAAAPWSFDDSLFGLFRQNSSTTPFRLHLIQAFVPDVDIGVATRDAQFAETFFTKFLINASTIRVSGIQSISANATIDPTVGSAFPVLIERISYSITTERGAETTYYVDQAFPAGEESEKILLERLARRAVAEGGARR